MIFKCSEPPLHYRIWCDDFIGFSYNVRMNDNVRLFHRYRKPEYSNFPYGCTIVQFFGHTRAAAVSNM